VCISVLCFIFAFTPLYHSWCLLWISQTFSDLSTRWSSVDIDVVNRYEWSSYCLWSYSVWGVFLFGVCYLHCIVYYSRIGFIFVAICSDDLTWGYHAFVVVLRKTLILLKTVCHGVFHIILIIWSFKFHSTGWRLSALLVIANSLKGLYWMFMCFLWLSGDMVVGAFDSFLIVRFCQHSSRCPSHCIIAGYWNVRRCVFSLFSDSLSSLSDSVEGFRTFFHLTVNTSDLYVNHSLPSEFIRHVCIQRLVGRRTKLHHGVGHVVHLQINVPSAVLSITSSANVPGAPLSATFPVASGLFCFCLKFQDSKYTCRSEAASFMASLKLCFNMSIFASICPTVQLW